MDDSKPIIKIEDKSLVLKNEYEDINRVFGLKDLNIKFSQILRNMGTEFNSKFIKTKGWFLKTHKRYKYFKILIITSLVFINILFLLNVFLKTVENAVQFENTKKEEVVHNVSITQTNNEIAKKKYEIQKGDTLWVIARRNNTTVDEIFSVNPGLTENIKEGNEIILPN